MFSPFGTPESFHQGAESQSPVPSSPAGPSPLMCSGSGELWQQKWLPLFTHPGAVNENKPFLLCLSQHTAQFMRFVISQLPPEKVGQVSEAEETNALRNKSTFYFWRVNFPPLLFLHKAFMCLWRQENFMQYWRHFSYILRREYRWYVLFKWQKYLDITVILGVFLRNTKWQKCLVIYEAEMFLYNKNNIINFDNC